MKQKRVLAIIVGLLIALTGCGSAEMTTSPSADSPSSLETVPSAIDTSEGPLSDAPGSDAEVVATEPGSDTTADPNAAANAEATPDSSPDFTSGSRSGEPGAGGSGVFDISKHAFSFENYGNEIGIVNLSGAEMVRMFGDSVCGGGTGPSCRLLPTARAWMERTNTNMAGGHCEGLAALSLLMEEGVVKAADFGAPTASGLDIQGNTELQREIAYWWATQTVTPTFGSQFVGKPSEIVAELQRWFENPKGILGYTIGFYKPDGTGGHAVTPVDVRDTGDGVFDIGIYDNNYPGERRVIKVDTKTETWSYNGATIPTDAEGKYEGDLDTQTLDLTPTETRLTVQDCPFCGNDGSSGVSGGEKSSKRVMQIFFDDASFEAGVRLEITKIGGGKLAGLVEDRIAGADLWNDDVPPSFRVPVNTAFQITLDERTQRLLRRRR